MKQKRVPPAPGRTPADPSRRGKSSQGSVAMHFTTEYVDRPYKCSRCKADAVFTAKDQKYTYEVRQANVNQQRQRWPAGVGSSFVWWPVHTLRRVFAWFGLRYRLLA